MNPVVKRLILTRPYSWIGIISLAVLANVAATKGLVFDANLVFDILTAFVIWFVATSIVEYFHRMVDGRAWTNPYIPMVSTILLAALLFYRNPVTMIFLPVIVVADFFYSMKIRNFIFSRFSFIIRGVLEISILMIIFFFHTSYNIAEFAPLLISVFLITDARNLIGDIRDVEYDKYIFPKRYGVRVSYLVSLVLILVSIAILQNIMLTLPLILFVLSMSISRDAYNLHRIFVLATTFFYANYIALLIGQSLFITNLLFAAVLLNFTYSTVPRKSNPRGVQFYSYNG